MFRIICLALLMPLGVFAQKNYLIYLKDKNGNGFNIEQAQNFLSQKALQRREKQQIRVHTSDLPLTENYVRQIAQLNAKILGRSRWLNALLVNCDEQNYARIQALPFVKNTRLMSISQVQDEFLEDRKIEIQNPKPQARTENYGASLAQVNQIGIDQMHAKGFTGKGLLVAVMDNGFLNVDANPAFRHLKILDTYDFTTNTKDVYSKGAPASHGAHVLSVLAAYSPNNVIGGAYEADYLLYKTEIDATEEPAEEFFWACAAERADSLGADIISTSLGYYDFDNPIFNYKKTDLDGKTAIITQAAVWAARKGIVVVKSVGNEGNKAWQTLTFPADADSILAVGAVSAGGRYSAFSSRGFTADGRVKPDVAAMGEQVAVISPSGFLNFVNGTSFAAPLVAGMVAGLWQANPQLNSFQIMDFVRRSASRYRNPNDSIGYGIPHFERANLLVTQNENTFSQNKIQYWSAQSLLWIDLENTANSQVSIYDILGRLIFQHPYHSQQIRLSLDALQLRKGLYVIQLKHERGEERLKIWKE